MNIDLRAANYEDMDFLTEMEGAIFQDAWSPQSIQEEIDALDTWPKVHICLVANQAIGYTISALVVDELQLYRIALAKDSRRKGYASQCLERLMQEAKARGAVVCTLEVREGNLPARKLYEKLGFCVVGRRERYYGKDEAALLMDCKIS